MKYFILLAAVGTVFGGLDEPSEPTPTPFVVSATCERDGKTYGFGESVPGRNPCEVGCICAPQGRIICATVDCAPINCGDFLPIRDPNLCCKVCPKCEINGTVYEPGDNLPVGEPCNLKCVCDRNGRISCEFVATSCPIAVCAPGTTQHVEQNPGQCCPNVTCVPNTCEVDGRSYEVGDEIPTDDPCETCSCIEGGDQSCAKIFCDVPFCGDGLQPITREDECCPSCRCVVNGTAYDVGDSLPSDNACKMCTCTRQGLLCESVGCPPPPPCLEPKRLVSRGGDGDCCSTYGCVHNSTCETNGMVYEFGFDVPSNDPCKESCFCRGDNKVTCVTQTCSLTSSCGGLPVEIPEGECCPMCPECIINGTSYEPGDKLPLGNPCSLLCTCLSNGRIGCHPIAVLCVAPPICPPGTELVSESVPGECCQNHTCVGDVTCMVDGVAYSVGDDIPQDDPCKRCVCGGDGEVKCFTASCRLTSSCGGLPLEIPQGECCPKCPVCDINGTSYEPGDRLPLGDPCSLLCTCTSERRVACHPIAVRCAGPVPCPSGTKLVTETVPGECCKKYTCANATCEVDGVTYSVGDGIPQEDPCIYCHCAGDGEVVCGATGCPLIQCAPGTVLVKTEVPGRCCPELDCVNITCEVDDVTYQLEDKVPHEDPCFFCHCAIDEGAKGRVICAAVSCARPSCAPGLEYHTREGECCGKCRCVVDEVAYDIGDKIPKNSPCESCECTESGLACTSISCPPPLVCPPFHELVVRPVEGECCPEQMCSQGCPPPCTRKLCKSNANALCSTPSGGSCVSACNVTTCKACYYSEEPPRSLPTGCEKYNCEAVKNDATRVSKCLKLFGRCIGKQDRKQYGKPESSIVRPRNFKCYAYPCGE